LKRGVRTVQRWEREAGLPVRRLATEKRGTVYAYKAEIDAWRENRSTLLAAEQDKNSVPQSAEPSPLRRKIAFGGICVFLIAAVAIVGLWISTWRITSARRLTFEGNVLTPALSPNRKWIAFSSPRESADGNLDLWIRSTTDGTQSRLTARGKHEIDPVFSPDSSHILGSPRESDKTPIFQATFTTR